MFNFKTKEKEVFSPVDGELITIDQVNDPVFANKMMGDGFAVKPTNGRIFAPIKGKVASVFPTKHAIGLVDKEGVEVLVHIGIDTVDLAGEGFKLLVKEGASVKNDTPLIEVDLDYLAEKGKESTTMVVFTNLKDRVLEIETGSTEAQAAVGRLKK